MKNQVKELNHGIHLRQVVVFFLETRNIKIEKDMISNMKEESMDYDDNQLQATNFDNASNSYSVSG
jgi:hypothetical protein